MIGASLITVDGAYHCPVGHWPFLHNIHERRRLRFNKRPIDQRGLRAGILLTYYRSILKKKSSRSFWTIPEAQSLHKYDISWMWTLEYLQRDFEILCLISPHLSLISLTTLTLVSVGEGISLHHKNSSYLWRHTILVIDYQTLQDLQMLSRSLIDC